MHEKSGGNKCFWIGSCGFQCLKQSLFSTTLQLYTHIHCPVRVCQQRRRFNGQQVPTNEGPQIHHERTTACPDLNRNRHQSDGHQWWRYSVKIRLENKWKQFKKLTDTGCIRTRTVHQTGVINQNTCSSAYKDFYWHQMNLNYCE